VPVLKNPKHERFAQERAKGASVDEAYQLAGFNAHRGNAHRLSTNESILRRVRELQEAGAKSIEFEIEDALRWHLEVLRTPVGQITKDHPLAQEYTETVSEHSTSEKIKMPSKMDAIREISKLRGWYEADKQAAKQADALTGIMQHIANRKA
jgi:hypothetical protein